MTNIYNLSWPVNYQQQVELARRLESKVSELEARRINIVLRQPFAPTQAQWENAWVEQTSQPLPIPPGVRLCWYNLSRGTMEAFTTAYDLLSGQTSSGAVYQFLDNTFNRPPFRLLGYYDSALGHSNTSNGNNGAQIRTVHMPWNLSDYNTPWNPYTLAKYGLLNLMLVYRLRYNTTNNALRFFLNLGNGDNFSWWPQDSEKEADQVNVEVLAGASTPTSQQTTGAGATTAARHLGGRPVNSNSPANTYSNGVLMANNLTIETKDGAPHREYSGFMGWHMTTRIDALSAGNFGFNSGSWIKVDPWGPPGKRNFMSIVGDTPGGSGQILGKAWLYGFFTQNTQELREDDRL